jgi:hypothetical protein
MANEPVFQTNVTTDAQGNWRVSVPEDITPGLHTVVATDPSGNTDSALLFIEQAAVPDLNAALGLQYRALTQPLLAPFFVYCVFFLLLIVLALALNMVRLGQKVDLKEMQLKDREIKLDKLQKQELVKEKRLHSHLRQAQFIAVVAILLAVLAGLGLNFGLVSTYRPQPVQTVDTVYVSVAGAVVAPFSKEPVRDVSLRSGDHVVRTDASGQYSFDQIKLADSLTLTHPLLARTLVKTLEEMSAPGQTTVKLFPVSLYFDPAMFNALIAVLDLEARGRYADIYDRLAPEIMKVETREAFVSGYRAIFGPADLTDQAIVIECVTPYSAWNSSHQIALRSVVEILVQNDGKKAVYRLMETKQGWLLVK